MARGDPQINIRVPADLKAKLDVAAEKAGRTLTAEIVFRLEQSLSSGRTNEAIPAQPEKLDMRKHIMRGILAMQHRVDSLSAQIAALKSESANQDPETKQRLEISMSHLEYAMAESLATLEWYQRRLFDLSSSDQ